MSPSRPGEDGFTLVELMVAVAVTALIGLVVWQGAVRAQKTMDRMFVRSGTTIRTLRLERFLREHTGRVRIPYWIGSLEPLVDGGAGTVEIPFYAGEADLFLVVKQSDASLLIGVRGGEAKELSTVHQFDGISEILFDVVENDAGELLGVRYEVFRAGNNDQPVVITAGFGSNPFWFTAR
jgi:prepilin-type N-terminal cleavage/methylation domain-containing protein